MDKVINKICPICGRVHNDNNKEGYCYKHWYQMYKYSKFLDNNPRNKYDPNEIVVKKDYAELYTYDKLGNKLHTYIIDIEDIPIASQYKWHSKKSKKNNTILYYLSTGGSNTEHIYYHRMIMGFPNKTIDHIDNNTFNNRKENLREASMSEQIFNSRKRKNTLCKIKGVYQDNRGFHVEIKIGSKRIYTKRFSTIEEAAYMRFLLEQLIPNTIIQNTYLEYIEKLSEEQKKSINKYFINRFKNRVL